ncbi:MAG: ABC transporter ATP-binding protein [Bacteroidetes bacterium]|nr:ABC transporter ATP-binding protein [Bacteroidota bacterium]
MADESVILKVENLQIRFEGANAFTAVNKVSFQITKGVTLAIVGESGSGKSLTALALMGLLPKSASMSGEIILQSEAERYHLNNTNNKEWQDIRGKETAMVFQEPMSSLNPIMKVGRQLAECILTHQKISKSEAKQLAIEWLAKVQLPEPAKMYDRYPHQLSGGQKQRVMIAMAMCNHPVLLIADEPTTALDVTVQQEIIRLMGYLQEEHNTAMIFITHDLALAATIADDVLVMYRGEMVEYGNADDVLKAPKDVYTKALLASKPSAEHKGLRLPTVADFMNAGQGAEAIGSPQYKSTVSEELLLQVKDLNVWFTEESNMLGKAVKYFKAVDDVSFTLHRGEILGLVGESGCGKSTLSRSLMGLLPVHSGQILFNNEDIAAIPAKEWRRIRRQIQMIFQDPYGSLNPRMTIGDMLEEPMRIHNIVPVHELKKEALRLLDLVQLPADALKRYPHQFSGGQRQRIGIARALALRPQLLICDESVSALDVSVQAQILNLLKELQQEFRLTYLFISHDLSVVHYISDRVMVMQAGKIVESGDAEQVLKYPKNAYTQKLINSMPTL